MAHNFVLMPHKYHFDTKNKHLCYKSFGFLLNLYYLCTQNQKINQLMNKLVYVFLIVAAMAVSCTGGKGSREVSGADSTYMWENVRMYYIQEPELALRMLDTAEMRGVMTADEANLRRGLIYYDNKTIQDFDKAISYTKLVLNSTQLSGDSAHYIQALSQLVSILRMNRESFPEAIQYCMEGAQRAHSMGDLRKEADFYFEVGFMMEKTQYGSGMDYIDRSLDMLREQARTDWKPLPVLSSNLGNTARRLAERGNNARAVELLKERLEIVDRIEREVATAPKGYCDETRALTYGVMAYCQWAMGRKDEARQTAEAFEKIRDKVGPDYLTDIMNYYAFSGDAVHTQQIYDELEPLYREKQDTISDDYVSLLDLYSQGIGNAGRYKEAYEVLQRHNVLSDSLVQRQRQQETLQYAQQFQTQEKEMELKEKEAEARIHLIIIIALVAFLVAVIVFLWRITLAHRRLQDKNRQLFDTVQQLMREADERQQALSRQPQTALSASQQLYNRICQLMREEQSYTDSDLNRESLAQKLGTNYNAVAAAIRECADGLTIGDFLDDWRLRHAAHLLAQTTDPVGLIIEQSGFASRSHFTTLFRDKFKMTPSEYRKVAKEKA